MIGYFSSFMEASALLGALCGGFMLAQGAGRRPNQLAACLVIGASWWAMSNANCGAARDAVGALSWMRLGAPGWAFIGGLLPHLGLRYLDIYPQDELARVRRMAAVAASTGYAAGGLVLLCVIFFPETVYREVHPVAWGWNHVPGALQRVFFAIATPCGLSIFPIAYKGLRSSVAVAPMVQRISIYASMSLPALAVGTTELTLPIAGIDFPRLGAPSYSLFGAIFVVAVLRYGISFLVANRFSHEILDTLNEGVAMLTPIGHVRHVNRCLERMSGFDADELIGRHADVLLERGAPVADGVTEEPANLLTREGGKVPVSLSVASVRDQQGNDMGLVVVARDMREIRALRRQVVTKARLAAVGELAAGVAHEINNPLAFVNANLGQMEGYVKSLASRSAADARDETEEAEAIDAIHECIEGVERVTAVVQAVRRFTDSGRMPREPAGLNALLEDAIGMARLQDRSERIHIDFLPGDLPETWCSPRDLRQVFLGLLANAMEATSGRGTIRVATRDEGDQVVAEIADEGRGMSADQTARIFDPFYTTKTMGEGTGLGLTIAWHVVQAHDGEIDVQSSLDEGTTFRVRFPARLGPDPSTVG